MLRSSQTAPVNFLLLSDTHAFSPPPYNSPGSEQCPDDSIKRGRILRHPLPNISTPTPTVLIHAGDLTMTGLSSEMTTTYNFIASHPAELKIVIPGNHDTTLDVPYYQSVGSRRFHSGPASGGPQDIRQIRDLWTGETAKSKGIAYMEEGIKSFTVSNGASFTVYVSAWTPEFCNWAFAYERDEDRFNHSISNQDQQPKNPIPDFPEIDIIITHGPPYGFLDPTYPRIYPSSSTQSTFSIPVGCKNLLKAVHRSKPLLHVFGHIHEGYGATVTKWNRLDNELLTKLLQDPKALTPRPIDHASVDKKTIFPSRNLPEKEGEAGEVWLQGTKDLVRGEETLFVNASMLDERYKPRGRMWVVELELSVGEKGGRG
ncbi:putative ser thr protein phosphatase family protein [Phaeomoniella chlamydospora]|uniref:Putative ser thr protein phosphatase family protein n=1 Tax=Phaeomoniella chlamydospora TaxID=158046 RepID=A0A0G2H4A5_PHACM|nr:putative ser thr protein phosphatase family protein [Phaeomoniella chlamydospora]